MDISTSVFGQAFALKPRSVQIDREEDFVDITLPIVDHQWSEDGSLIVAARGEINSTVISFIVELESQWNPKKIEDTPITMYWGKGHMRSTGSESDAFLGLLAREYNLPSPAKMEVRTEITMGGMNCDPSLLATDPAMIKIFFESGGDEKYGEAFINIDLDTKTLQFRDKDPEYHSGILSSLGCGI